MAQYEHHVFVCTNTRPEGSGRPCCLARGSGMVRDRFKELVKEHGLRRRIRINSTTCMDQCEHGVTVVVYPEAVWYGFVQPEDVDEIFEFHLLGGRPVERLRLPPGCINTERCPHKGPAKPAAPLRDA